jgi:hypothetical protein
VANLKSILDSFSAAPFVHTSAVALRIRSANDADFIKRKPRHPGKLAADHCSLVKASALLAFRMKRHCNDAGSFI